MTDAVVSGHQDPSNGDAISGRPVILQVLPRLETGGVEVETVDMAAAIAAAGWVSLVASAGGAMVREIERVGAEHVRLPLHSKNPFVMRANVGRLAELIRARHVDIVHARSRAPAWSARAAARRTGARFVTTFHGNYTETNWLKRRYNSIMAEGERVIAISDFIAGRVASGYGVPKELIRLVPRGIDLDIFDPAAVSRERMTELSAAWRLPAGLPVIMLPGRLTRWKGQHVLVEALARLGRRDVHCVLVGADQGRKRYRREVDDHVERAGLSGIVQVVGQCHDMPAAYMLSDVVVSASTSPEAFGRVAVEAQAMGRPVIASDHGGAQETVLQGETGWLVRPGDPDALASTLGEFLAISSEDRARLAARAIENVRAHFTSERMRASTIEVYNELLAGHAATAV